MSDLSGIPGFAEREPCVVCAEPGVVGINTRWYCLDHLDAGFTSELAGPRHLVELVQRQALIDAGERATALLDMGLLGDDLEDER